MAEPPSKSTKRFTGSFRRVANQIVKEAGVAVGTKEPMLTAPATPPWLDGGDIKFHPELIGKSSRKDPAEVRKADAEETLARLRPAWLQVFTNGSAVEGLRKGGAGIVLYVTEDELVVHEDCVPAGALCGSYRAEMTGLDEAVPRILGGLDDGWLAGAIKPGEAIRFCTDSQSAVRSLAKGASAQTIVKGAQIWSGLLKLSERTGCAIDVQFVPGHAGIEGNERADKMAAQGSKLSQSNVPIDHATAKAAIEREVRRNWKDALDNPSVQEEAEEDGDGSVSGGARAGRAGDVATYVSDVSEDEASGGVDGSAPRVSSLDVYRKAAKGKAAKFTGVPGSTPGQVREQERALSQMRAGKCPLMRGYLNLIRRGRTQPERHCEDCAKYDKDNSPPAESVVHFLVECKHKAMLRMECFEKSSIGVEVLFTEPVGVLRFLSREGRINLPEPPGAATASS